MANKKHFVWGMAATALLFGAAFIGCDNDSGSNTPSPNVVPPVSDFDLSAKVTAPKTDVTIPASFTADQYDGAITWYYYTDDGTKTAVDLSATPNFDAETHYDAEVTLTVKSGYTMPDNPVFTHAQALSESYDSTTKIVTLTFSPTVYSEPGLYVGYNPEPEDVTANDIATAFTWLSTNAAANTRYTIVLDADDVDITDTQSLDLIHVDGVIVALIGLEGERKIGLAAAGTLFTIGSATSSKLVLGNNITLQGLDSARSSLVVVNGGTFEMLDGSKITGQINTNVNAGNAGGVHIGGGTFNMKGGEISGNKSGRGGGVVVVGSGTFNISGGKIKANIASEIRQYVAFGGGGVFIGSDGVFNKTGGIIYGVTDDTPDADSNKVGDDDTIHYSKGNAVYLYYSSSTIKFRDSNANATDNMHADPSNQSGW